MVTVGLVFQPGCVNTTEIDIKKACRMNKAQRTNKFTQNASCSGTSEISVKKDASATKEQSSQKRIERNVKVSKIVEGSVSSSEINYIHRVPVKTVYPL